jgi:TPR repeat protein
MATQRLILPVLVSALAFAACGQGEDAVGPEAEAADVRPLAKLDPKEAAAAAEAKKLADALAVQKPQFDAAKAANDDLMLDDLADAGNGWALHDRAQKRLASQDYSLQQGGFADMEKAAELGVADAQMWVGIKMAYGQDGYKLQPNSGLKMMERAARQGNVEAILAVGQMYEADAYMHDTQKAIEWYQRAVDLGSEKAKEALARVKAAGEAS